MSPRSLCRKSGGREGVSTFPFYRRREEVSKFALLSPSLLYENTSEKEGVSKFALLSPSLLMRLRARSVSMFPDTVANDR